MSGEVIGLKRGAEWTKVTERAVRCDWLDPAALIMSASLSHPAPTETTMTLAPTPAPLDPTSRTELPIRSPLSILRHALVQ